MTATLERELGDGQYLLASAQSRAAALARAGRASRCVLVPLRVWRRPDAVVAFSIPVAPGVSLAELGRELTLGECVAVGLGVAQALAAMHEQRLAHGDVSAANVMVDGRQLVLVDTMGALQDAAPASPQGDVAALGELLRGLADADAAPVIEAWTAPLVREDPASRPTAAHALAALARCAPPQPIAGPAAPVAAAIRSGALPRTVRRPADRWWRLERATLRIAPLAAVAVVGAFVGAGLVPAFAADADAGTRARDAAVALTYERVAALAEGDAAALAALTAPGSPAAADNPERIEPFTGLAAEHVSAQVKEATPNAATVEVTSELSGYRVGATPYPASTVTAVLELSLTPQGWLVERILPPP